MHLTPIDVFEKYIYPEIKHHLYDYIWVDLFAGEGNLVLPILKYVPEKMRVSFFERQMYLFDIQSEMVEKAIKRAESYGIPREVAEKNIQVRDTLKNYPTFILNKGLSVYHITNPPYLYKGYITKHAKHMLEYFSGENEKYQDLYQLALINDLRHRIEKMIYIIPSNFLYGYSVSNAIRIDLLKHYLIEKAVIFEKEVFEYTGTNVALIFFNRKKTPREEVQKFSGMKVRIDGTIERRDYVLKPKNYYRAGNEFEEFVETYKALKPLKVKFYLTLEEVRNNPGKYKVLVIDANSYDGKRYSVREIFVSKELYDKIKSNILSVRTLDSGMPDGRAGLYVIKEVFWVDGILVTKATYRTHPIQLFFEPLISVEDQLMLKDYFNILLEYFRDITDSEFMTTYKYSNSQYTRKYLGLNQVRKLIETFPILNISAEEKTRLLELIRRKDARGIYEFIKRINGGRKTITSLDAWMKKKSAYE